MLYELKLLDALWQPLIRNLEKTTQKTGSWLLFVLFCCTLFTFFPCYSLHVFIVELCLPTFLYIPGFLSRMILTFDPNLIEIIEKRKIQINTRLRFIGTKAQFQLKK